MTDSASTGAANARRYDDILVVTIDHPPVNALSAAVRGDLAAAVRDAQADPQVRAILLMGAGKNFIAGADIREFGKPPQPPILPDVCNQIEA
ncbi:enoyl-CoA hydratase/isomerase family protein, partial [Achromobacter aegrifaciens]